MRFPLARLPALLSVAIAAPLVQAEETGEVNIYSYRQPYLIESLLKEFTDETGIKVNVIFADKGLIERIAAEGRNSPADVLLTPDPSRRSRDRAAVRSPKLEAAVPPAYRASDGQWWALPRRARVVYAYKERVKHDAISYEELADPKWRGKICVRSGQHVYNVALIASMIAHRGGGVDRGVAQGGKGQPRPQACRQ